MSEFKKVLVPIDFSEHSKIALQQAWDLARRFDAKLHLLHVNEPWPPAASVTSDAYPMYHEYVMQENSRAEQALHDLTLPGPEQGAIRATRAGHVEQEILKYADEQGIDLIVIGTHGRTGVAHWFMGSVAEKIVRYAKCPVLVARPMHAAESKAT